MKEIRPSTWITLAILALLIFVPAFFIDVDSFTPPVNGDPVDNTVRPINPLGTPDREPDNRPAPNKPPEKSKDNRPDNEPVPVD